jgi:hypothetical protein
LRIDGGANASSGCVVFLFEDNDSGTSIDHRLVLPKKLGPHATKEYVLEKTGDSARYIRSKQNALLVYARLISALEGFGTNIVIPGAMVIDQIVPPTSQDPVIVPILLRMRSRY